jgi:hypothetical protein
MTDDVSVKAALTAAESTLNADEAEELAECEAVLIEDLAAFIRVGRVLLRIRDGRLYRDSYLTFEEYCREAWQISRTSAFERIEAAKVVDNLQTFGMPNVPHNQRVAQELVPLRDNPQLMVEVWQQVLQEAQANGRKPSAVAVQRAVRQRNPNCMTSPLEVLATSLRELVLLASGRALGLGRIGVDDLVGLSDEEISEYGRAATRAKSGLKKLGDLDKYE